jgi:hypothetical protein
LSAARIDIGQPVGLPGIDSYTAHSPQEPGLW